MKELTCIVCPKGCRLHVDEENGYAVTGNSCPRGAVYGEAELRYPVRVLTSTVRVEGALHSRCPVKTDQAIGKEKIMAAMALLDEVTLQAPVEPGQVVARDILGTGVNFITSRGMEKI
ncbi:MAG: DUF1667 domain-containing protein [Oscillospiraceae bacterium]|nr:DUF1667 domain-containing protein [Oscillospiraceae bacterium]